MNPLDYSNIDKAFSYSGLTGIHREYVSIRGWSKELYRMEINEPKLFRVTSVEGQRSIRKSLWYYKKTYGKEFTAEAIGGGLLVRRVK